jgi:outer membrane protein
MLRFLVVCCCLFFSTSVLATKVAVVEIQKIFAQSKQAKAYQQEIENEFSPRQKILQGKQGELDLKVRSYEKNRLTMSDKEARTAEKEIITMRQEYQSYRQTLQQELQQKQQKNVRSVEARIEKVVAQIAKKKGYDLVLFQGIAFHNPSLNITQEVIDIMNKK